MCVGGGGWVGGDAVRLHVCVCVWGGCCKVTCVCVCVGGGVL